MILDVDRVCLQPIVPRSLRSSVRNYLAWHRCAFVLGPIHRGDPPGTAYGLPGTLVCCGPITRRSGMHRTLTQASL